MQRGLMVAVGLLAACGNEGSTVRFIQGPSRSDAGVSASPDAGSPAADAGVCVNPTSCLSSSECCSGFCSWMPYAYIPTDGTCEEPQPEGAYCERDSWCASGLCRDNVCRSAECLPVGSSCTWGDPCCPGAFCNADYIAGQCEYLHGDGADCMSSSECHSGSCVEGVCRATECQAEGYQCWDDSACCEGFCTWDASTYAPGHCATRQPAGAACVTARWCAGGSCVDGTCH